MSDTDITEDKNEVSSSATTGGRRLLSFATRLIIPLCILAAAAGFLKHQIDTRPQAQRMKPPREARLITVETAHVEDCRTSVAAMGTVTPAKQITVSPEVSGVVTRISPAVMPGGLIHAGQELFAVDARDYEAIVSQRQSDVARARLNLELEQGNQTVAQAEYDLLEETVGAEDEDLVLRKPHLVNAEAALEAANAALEKARLDVERCTVKAPFNAVIMDKYVDIGARVSPTSPLIRVTGTDEYWIEAAVGVDELVWLDIPSAEGRVGSTVKVLNPAAWGSEANRQGHVLRLLSEVEPTGRMAKVLVSVGDPLNLDARNDNPVLLNGSYVRMEIEGRTINSVVAMPRAYLRDGNTVWIMNDADALEIRPVKVVFADNDVVYLADGVKEGERIVTADLAAAVDGMPLRIMEDAQTPKTTASDAGGPR